MFEQRKSRLGSIGALALMGLGLVSCTSTLSGLNRRPFSDKMAFVGLQPGPYAQVTSSGKFREDVCNKKWFGLFGSSPEFEDVKKVLIEEKKFKYVTNVTSLEYSESGFLGGNKCVGFEGEGFR